MSIMMVKTILMMTVMMNIDQNIKQIQQNYKASIDKVSMKRN